MNGDALPARQVASSAGSETRAARLAEVSVGDTIELATRVAAALAIAACVIALVVRVALASAARRWLAYPFDGIPARPGEAAAIFLHNFQALLAVGGLLLVAQSRQWPGKSAGGPLHGAIRRAGEVLLASAVAANVIVVGASLGAYGERMISAALPHGPVELAAYSLALALYLEGRAARLPARHALAIAALSISMLALAAALETFVNL